jgi:uracil-DNA glycosylase family 4
MAGQNFDPNCRKCPRLADHLSRVRDQYPSYHSRPVPAFGVARPKLLIVGLAPGLHGANASGRPFTGDEAGKLLFRVLYEFGFSNRSDSRAASDELILYESRITNAVQCLPPKNRPIGQEVSNCNGFLKREIALLPPDGVILALGQVAHRAVIQATERRQKDFVFTHHRIHNLIPGRLLVDSYHCSRYNVQTMRLTLEMFRNIFQTVRGLIE